MIIEKAAELPKTPVQNKTQPKQSGKNAYCCIEISDWKNLNVKG